MNLYNTIHKKIEQFTPISKKTITVYCCGPTVYDYAHIGNFRTYTTTDLLVRALRYLNKKSSVTYSMNITDVGHLVSDGDTGEDKLEKGARREGKTARDIADFYTNAFIEDSKKLNLIDPDFRPHAASDEFIAKQIEMIQKLVDKGFGYVIDDGIYFDTSMSKHYGELTGQKLDDLLEGARVEPNLQKRNPTDFALWKFSPKDKKRDMEWQSPWGVGFPGWHIECSAMSMATLGVEQIDIHTGGADLIPVHHTNEIAQSEAATGKRPFVRYWVHGQFILVDNQKMSKSKGNFYTLKDIVDKGFDPLALRYLYMTAHYRSFLNFTWEALTAAQNALSQLRNAMRSLDRQTNEGLSKQGEIFRNEFQSALSEDLNMSVALRVLWDTVKADISGGEKRTLLEEYDSVIGLGLDTAVSDETDEPIPKEIIELIENRNALRSQKQFEKADEVRKRIEELGYVLEDTPNGQRVKKNVIRTH